MEIIYRKVFIKSEADLPKKRGEYYFFHRIGESILRHICYCHKTDDMELLPKAYMDNYDWYLQPVELPSDEDIKNEGFLYAKRVQTVFDNEIWAFKAGMKLMRDKLINK